MSPSVERVLENDEIRMAIDPNFGCRWITMQAKAGDRWHELLWPSPPPAEQAKRPFEFGAYLMAPWCNRIPGGIFRFRRYSHALRSNFPDGSAIHGDVFSRPWRVDPDGDGRRFGATFDSLLFSDFNFDWPVRVRHEVRLTGFTVRATLSVQNLSRSEAMPAGLGFHPFFLRRLSPGGAEAFLKVPGRRVYPSENAVPTGPAVDAVGPLNLQGGASLAGREFDHGFTGLRGEAAWLRWTSEGVSLAIKPDFELDHMFVYAPATHNGAPAPFVCVEPMSHAVDGFNLLEKGWPDTGVRVLQPQETFSAGWTMAVEAVR